MNSDTSLKNVKTSEKFDIDYAEEVKSKYQ